MRHPRSTLLAIAAASLSFTSALPSSLDSLHQYSAGFASSPPRSIWRTVSDKVIEKIWGLESERGPGRFGKQWQEPPSDTYLQHNEDILLRFNITTSDEAAALADVASFMYLDVWAYTDDWVDIRMAKGRLPYVLKSLPESLQDAHTALLQEKELAQAIYYTYPSPPMTRPLSHAEQPNHDSMFTPTLRPKSTPVAKYNVFFHDYQPLSVIQPWLRLMASLFSTHVRIINIGTSYEGRDIPVLRVGVHPTTDDAPPKRRKTVLITGGSHAREWISTSTVNYIAYSLITSYGKERAVTSLLEEFDFVFVPTLNPDGYVYTWESDRLWRKSRQKTTVRFCYGVDLDRSFSYHFDPSATISNPCSESYSGPEPFEAVEAQALAKWARNETENNNVEFVAFLDLHAYSQQILYPYSYSCDVDPPNLENLEEVAAGLAKAIRMDDGHVFEVRPACEGNVALSTSSDTATNKSKQSKKQVFPRFESGGGSALDWFYHEMKVRYSYQIKLRDRGSYGFLLPSEHIVPSGQEMLEAVMYLGKHLEEVFEMEEREDALGQKWHGKTMQTKEEIGQGKKAESSGAYVGASSTEGSAEALGEPYAELKRRKR